MPAPLSTRRRLAAVLVPAAAVLVLSSSPVEAQEPHAGPPSADGLGTVSFATSCTPEVQAGFERAVAMLHSFWYQAAERAFGAVADGDPECAMAHWGTAMSRFRQLWIRPGPEDVRVAREALSSAGRVPSTTERERAYVAAVEHVFTDRGDVTYLDRLHSYERAMRGLHERWPEDPEAAVFHALALLAVAYASPPDPSFGRQKEALAILEPVLDARPDHPGVAHYMIHATDYPALGEHGLEAARRYAAIAPDAPHALHMPSHIFTRLGHWRESAATNRAAAEAARRDGWVGEELHTTDYRVYAYLQLAEDRSAREMVESLPARTRELRPDGSSYQAGLYAAAAIPARVALELRNWAVAAELEVPSDLFPGGVWCWAEAPLHVARGLGAIHTGRVARADASVHALAGCRERLLADPQGGGADTETVKVNASLWANRLDVQRRVLLAWLALGEGRSDEAVRLARAAADLEDAGDKPPITPGSVVPARELLAEMLLELDRPAEALTAFERTLEETPNRFRSVYGAARAARLAGDDERARAHYAHLLELGADGDPRPALEEAARFGAGASSPPGRVDGPS